MNSNRMLCATLAAGLLSLVACKTSSSTAGLVPAPKDTRLPQAELYVLKADAQQTLAAHGVSAGSLSCNSAVFYNPKLYGYSKELSNKVAALWPGEVDAVQRKKAARLILGYMVRANFQAMHADNLGVMALQGYRYKAADGSSKPLLIFRSGTMVDPQSPTSCISSLLAKADVRHVINFYSGTFPLHDFIRQEAEVVKKAGGTHYNAAEHRQQDKPSWRDLIEEEDEYEAHRTRAMQEAAQLIKSQVLNPNGRSPTGNILLHCGGGMHRTGMIYGILRKCINNDAMADIEAEYKYHVDYRNKEYVGGYEELNLRFIKDFDCNLLK